MNRWEKLILQNLLKRGYALEQRAFLNEFPPSYRTKLLDAICHLQELGFVMRDTAENGIVITLSMLRRDEALKAVSFLNLKGYSDVPLEEMIPARFSKPILIAKGEHLVHGAVSTYVICSSVKNSDDIYCLVINPKNDIHTIHLGDIHDPSSLISRALKEIDARWRNALFTREDLKINLPKNIVQNNQPTKAIVEYLCHEKYLIRYDYAVGPSKFERTGKIHPISTLDEIMELHEKKPFEATLCGIKYAITEEDGLIIPYY